jgi:hypothetical protein
VDLALLRRALEVGLVGQQQHDAGEESDVEHQDKEEEYLMACTMAIAEMMNLPLPAKPFMK